MEHILLGFIALTGGLLISFGLVALIIELNLIPRFSGVTHTAQRIRLYEKCVIAGAIAGNFMTVYPVRVPLGTNFAGFFGLFAGIYLGSWIIALTEVIDLFPVLSKKTGVKVGMGAIILATAVGKCIFSLLYYYKGW